MEASTSTRPAHARSELFGELPRPSDVQLCRRVRLRRACTKCMRTLQSHRELVLDRPDAELAAPFPVAMASHVSVTSCSRSFKTQATSDVWTGG